MKVINVTLNSVRVANFVPRELSLELVAEFNDGNERSIRFKVSEIESERTSAEILSRIRKHERAVHQNKESETILDSIVTVNINNYSETFEKLYNFISRISERIVQLKSGKSEGYISNILAINSMKVEF